MMREHGDLSALALAMFIVLSIGVSFCACAKTAAYNTEHPVSYRDVFKLSGIVSVR